MRAHKAHVRPEGLEGAWRASHAMLWFLRSPPASAPSYMSYTSYMSYRVVLCGTSQTCRGCRENFSLPGCGAAPHTFNPSICQSANSFVSLVGLCALCGKKLAVLRVFVEMGFHKKTPGAMPSGVGLPGVLCKEPYWMEESVSFPACRSARRAGGPAPSGSSPSPRGSWCLCRAPGTNGRSRWRRRSA